MASSTIAVGWDRVLRALAKLERGRGCNATWRAVDNVPRWKLLSDIEVR